MWRAVTRLPIPGATVSSAAIARSPISSRQAAGSAPSGMGGIHWASTLMTCVPSGASATSDGSTSDGIVASSTGDVGSRPYFDGSNARSTSSIEVVPTWIRPRSSRASPPAAGTSGRPSSTRLTLASRPGVRMFVARQRSAGPSVTGSTSLVRSCCGSRPDTTAGAVISSPEASATPVTAPSSVVTATTRASVRISAPASRAADASASARADGPPRANTVSPAAPLSLPAASASSTCVVPADHGPIAV